MRPINDAYTTDFHIKRDRSGHLFQGRYKAILVDKNAYAKELQVRPQASHIEAMVDSVVENDDKLARNLKIYVSRNAAAPL